MAAGGADPHPVSGVGCEVVGRGVLPEAGGAVGHAGGGGEVQVEVHITLRAGIILTDVTVGETDL